MIFYGLVLKITEENQAIVADIFLLTKLALMLTNNYWIFECKFEVPGQCCLVHDVPRKRDFCGG